MTVPGEGVVTNKPESFDIGRGGLKVPNTEWQRSRGASSFAQFFQRLIALNSGWSPDHFYDYDRFIPRKLSDAKELVVPAEADRPLLVIRGEYKPRRVESLDLSRLGVSVFAGYDGTEIYDILTPPEGLGEFRTAVSVISSPEDYSVFIDGAEVKEPLAVTIPNNNRMTDSDIEEAQIADREDRLIEALEHTREMLS